MTPTEAAALLSLNKRTVMRYCACGKLKAKNIGTAERKVWRITEREVRRFLGV